MLPNLFGKFVSGAYKDPTYRGTGLGLYITKAIVTAHDGDISAYNNSERGATFTILLQTANGIGHGLQLAEKIKA